MLWEIIAGFIKVATPLSAQNAQQESSAFAAVSGNSIPILIMKE
jgi:hypothetical protein